jgi:chromosome segregation ATPase
MSTSPSWFDQEKFTRLVKKVGTRPLPEVVPKQPGPPVENPPQAGEGEGLASTARISLVSRPPSLLSERRALPALPRRTGPIPSMKTAFPAPAATPTAPVTEPTESGSTESKEAQPEVVSPSDEAKPEAEAGAAQSQEEDDDSDLTALWQKMALLNEELARANQERDHALHESEILRQQLDKADGTSEGPGGAPSELARLMKERDEARAEAQALRAQLPAASTTDQPGGFSKTKEIGFLSTERDQARKEYAELRKQYEDLKREQSPKEDSAKFRKELEQQLEGFRQKLEERNKEVAALKANTAAAGGGDEGLRQEMEALREQLTRAKSEASVAQRGLALSQKALHETRDALREATEGTSMSRHNFDNLKKECATLTQQNTVLQAQNDQLTRELAATKSKMTTRL